MTNNKTSNAPKGAGNQRAGRGAVRPPQAGAGPRGQRRQAGMGNVDEAIAKAQQGRVNVTPAKAVEMAGKLYSQRQFAQAARTCNQIIAARPANADAQNILGVSLAALGRFDDAIAAIRRAIKINAQAPSYYANLGEVLRQAGKADEAIEPLEEAVKLDPNNAQALNNLGIVNFERKKFADAIGYYRRALEQRPEMAEALNNLGNALRVTGDVEGAINAYQDALTQRAS